MDPTPDLPALSLFDLHGSNALITGATRGIGAACALAFAQAGAKLCLVQRHPASDGLENKDTYNAIIAAGGSATIIHCDLEDLDQVRGLFPRALEAMGGDIHVLVNCAGIQRRNPAIAFPETDWDDVININLKVCWILAQAAGQHMVPLRRGKIINMCSLLTFQGGLTVPAYAAAKGALGQLTKALANEWSQHNVQVNGICPGYIATDMNEKLLKDPVRLRQISERIPAGRWGQPKDFAGPVVFLASRASQYVCGEILVVDGVSRLQPFHGHLFFGDRERLMTLLHQLSEADCFFIRSNSTSLLLPSAADRRAGLASRLCVSPATSSFHPFFP